MERLLRSVAQVQAGWCVPVAGLRTAITELLAAGRTLPIAERDYHLGDILLRAARNCYDREAMEALLYGGDAPAAVESWLGEAIGDAVTSDDFRRWYDDSAGLGLYERSYALLIGAASYPAGWGQLHNVAEDLGELQRELRRAGFETPATTAGEQPLLNPTKEEFEDAVKAFVGKHGRARGAALLVYWAGHGYDHSDGVESQAYLVPIDAPVPTPESFRRFHEQAINLDDFKRWFAEIGAANHSLIILDSCHSGKALAKDKQSSTDFDRIAVRKPAQVYIASGARAVPAGSRFRQELVDALRGCADRDRNRHLTATETAHYLQLRLREPSPEWAKARDAAEGDFVFELERPAERVDDPDAPARCPLDSPHLTEEERVVRGALADRLVTWDRTRNAFEASGEPRALEAFLDLASNSIFAALARRILERVDPAAAGARALPSS